MSDLRIPVECPRCEGTGSDPELWDGDYHDCWDCENNRRIWITPKEATFAQLQEAIDERVEEREACIARVVTLNSELTALRAEWSSKVQS